MDARFTREWLEDLGYSGLDDGTASSLIQTVYERLELRVGQVLCDSLEEWQVNEFEALVDGDAQLAQAWADHYGIHPFSDPLYLRLVAQTGADDSPEAILSEWARVAWLRRNSPDYRVIVKRCFTDLEQELRDARAGILPVAR